MSENILTRSQIDEKYTWKLSDLFESDELWENELKVLSHKAKKLSECQGKIKDAETLLSVLKEKDNLTEKLMRVYAYAKMHRDEDNANSKYQAMTDRAMQAMTECAALSAFLVPEITQLGEENINSWISQNKELATYRHYLENVFRESKHILSASEEKLLTYMDEIGETATEVYDMFSDADLVFDKIEDEHGKKTSLTHGRYIGFLQNDNREVRERAFKAMYDAYEKWENTLAAMMSSNVKKTCYTAKIRNYKSALDMALSEDNIPTSVYTNLIETIHKAIPSLCEYLKVKQKLLNTNELHMYDLYVPVVSIDEKKYTYEEAQELVLSAVKPLGEQYVSDMKRAFSERWVDVYETKGKTSGAYSWGSNDVHPFVLMNFQGTLNDVFTLAHEMGHAMHSFYTNAKQPTIYKDYKIFVAEVASTVNENLLMTYLLNNTTDKKLMAYLLGHRLEEFRTTVFRQTMFAEFELETHAEFERGEALNAEFLCRLYYDLNKKYMGSACTVDKEISYEWARIPHFYSDFYVYQYATGYSAAVALADAIVKESGASERYLEFLSSGNSDYPINVLAKAGADLNTPAPIETAIKRFEEDLKLFKELAGE